MRKTKFIAILLFAGFVLACAENSSSNLSAFNSNASGSQSDAISVTQERISKSNPSEPQAQKISLEDADQSQPAPVVVERKIIRNAELNLETDAPAEALQKITQIAESNGGFVVESTQSSSDVKTTTRDTVTMTIRVPSAKFNETLEEIRKTGNRVIVETVKGQDVTEEFIDIEARLKAKKALEEQFLEIMKRANSVDEALNIQRQIADVRGEIEQIEGRKRFLENQSALSTIKVKLQSPTAFAANSSGVFFQLSQSLSKGFDAALSFILFFVTAIVALLPFFILIVLPIYLLVRYLLKKNRKQRLASEIAREEIKNE